LTVRAARVQRLHQLRDDFAQQFQQEFGEFHFELSHSFAPPSGKELQQDDVLVARVRRALQRSSR